MNKIMLSVLFSTLFSGLSFAHVYTFSNHTKNDLKIRIQLGGFSEPWYVIKGGNEQGFDTKENYNNILESQKTGGVTFDLTKGPLDYSRKAGFCLANVQVSMKMKNGKFGAWKDVNPKWVDDNNKNNLLDATEEFLDATKEVAALVVDAAAGEGGDKVKDLPLGKLGKSIGKLITNSVCRNRHYDIVYVTDDEGKKLGIDFVTIAK